MATIAITGITGLAGGSVGQTLLSAGHRVIGISRRTGATAGGVDMRAVDLTDESALRDALCGCDMVLHFADRADRKAYTVANMGNAARVMTALRRAAAGLALERVIAASSVYAERDGAENLYARSKRDMEAVALAGAPGARALVLRLPPLHGPGARGTVRYIAQAASQGWPLPLGLAHAPRRFLSLAALGGLCVRLAELDAVSFKAATGKVWYPSDAGESSLSALARSIGGRRARLFPLPGIDRLVSGTLLAAQLASEQDNLFRATGWRAGG